MQFQTHTHILEAALMLGLTANSVKPQMLWIRTNRAFLIREDRHRIISSTDPVRYHLCHKNLRMFCKIWEAQSPISMIEKDLASGNQPNPPKERRKSKKGALVGIS